MLSPVRPRSVVGFERLAYLSMALTIASIPLNWSVIGKFMRTHPVLYPTAVLLVFAVQAWWIWLVARRATNWARWVSAIFAGYSVVQSIIDFDERVKQGPAAAVAYYLILLLLIAAVALLFLPDANAWFKAARPAAS